jgi:hypothetical protein
MRRSYVGGVDCTAPVIAAVAASASLACSPHPGLGSVTYTRGAKLHVLDLATCRETVRRAPRPGPERFPGLALRAARHGRTGSQAIVFHGRTVLTVHESYASIPGGTPGPIMLFGTSPDRRWVLYAIDPQNSASLAADGLTLRAVPSSGGRSHVVATGLLRDDYRAWCGRTLVVTAGSDRIATHHKRLVATGPPDWHARTLVHAPARAWGSLACTPDGRSVVVQSQPDSTSYDLFRTRWALWKVGLDGSASRLTSPPTGYSDESPRFAGGVLYFVRSRKGVGSLYTLRGGKLLGPLVSLGANGGDYGHRNWPYAVRR